MGNEEILLNDYKMRRKLDQKHIGKKVHGAKNASMNMWKQVRETSKFKKC